MQPWKLRSCLANLIAVCSTGDGEAVGVTTGIVVLTGSPAGVFGVDTLLAIGDMGIRGVCILIEGIGEDNAILADRYMASGGVVFIGSLSSNGFI